MLQLQRYLVILMVITAALCDPDPVSTADSTTTAVRGHLTTDKQDDKQAPRRSFVTVDFSGGGSGGSGGERWKHRPAPSHMQLPALGPAPRPVHLPAPRPRPNVATHSSHRPRCALDVNYCRFDRGYPRDKMNAIIDRYYNDIRLLYGDLHRIGYNDILHYENRTRYHDGSGGGGGVNGADGHFVCESEVDYVRPGWAQNVHGQWLAIVNTDKFPQTIRVEKCKFGGNRCEYLPPCFKSRCIQRYTYVKLVCADPYRPADKPVVDVFEIPSACSCFVEDFKYY